MKLAIIQARMGSTRLPGKVLMNIGKKPILHWVIERVKRAKLIDKVIVATSNKEKDGQIKKFCKKLDTECFRGSEEDVLARFYEASKAQKADIIVRITADCPFVDPLIIDKIIKIHLKNKNDYTANDTESSYPKGTDVEVFNFKSLEKAHCKAKKTYQREHVTPYLYEHPKNFKVEILKAKGILKRPEFRLCVDKKEDLKVVSEIYNKLKKSRKKINIFNIIKLLDSNPKLAEINTNIRQKSNV